MKISELVAVATDKTRFESLDNYFDFCCRFMEFLETDGPQALIVAQRETNYFFYQFREDATFNISRPINSNLIHTPETIDARLRDLRGSLESLRQGAGEEAHGREHFVRTVYTLQQCIGATLDALPANQSNTARKLNGDLFERLIRMLIVELGVDCVSGTMQVPVKDANGQELFKSSYQHDLLLSKDGELKVIGSVKTSSKDRIDKVFMDKFLYNRLTDTELPHIAIFLNDVQRKVGQGTSLASPRYGVNGTFLSGHFKAYTVKLNPLDGVYYCDIRPNMRQDEFLAQHITTLDFLFFRDLGHLLARSGQRLDAIELKEPDDE